MQPTTTAGIVPCVFHDPEEAAAAISELRALGFDDDDEPDVAVSDPAHHRVLDNGFGEAVRGIAAGSAFGAAIGAVTGAALLLLTARSLSTDPVAVVLAGLYVGALFGAYLGSILGLAAAIRGIEGLERLVSPASAGDETLVVVVAREQSQEVRALMRRYHGVPV